MRNIKKPTGFNIKELIDEATYSLLGDEAWKLFDERLLITLDKLKTKYDYSIIANTWMFKSNKYGSFTQRGYRSKLSNTGTKSGAHYLGMGVDLDFYKDGNRIEPNVIRHNIIADRHCFPHIRCLEIDVNWVHIDVMGPEDSPKRLSLVDGKILLYSPKGNSKII